jgi:carbamoyl-phosphate synthase large subunit
MKILITGAGSVMGQSIYKALAIHNFDDPVEIHFGNSDELGAGMYLNKPQAPIVARPIFPLATAPEYLDTIKSYIRSNKIDIVFSGTQHEIGEISKLRDESNNAATLNHSLTMLALNKLKLSEHLETAGLPIPGVQSLTDFQNQPTIKIPFVIKPIKSSASRSIFRILADNEFELKEVLRRIGNRSDEFVVQEYLVGDEFTCGCYTDRYTGEDSIIILRRSLTADGATGFGQVVENEEIKAYVKETAKLFVHAGNDFGHINVQLILTDKGPRLFEINGRLSSTEAPKAFLGFNSSAAFIDNLVYCRPAKLGPIKTKQRFLRYYEEVFF